MLKLVLGGVAFDPPVFDPVVAEGEAARQFKMWHALDDVLKATGGTDCGALMSVLLSHCDGEPD